jgi:hypothetical protein
MDVATDVFVAIIRSRTMPELSREEFELRTQALLEQLKDMVQEEGWADIGVFPTVDSPGNTFNYSIGLAAYGGYEYMMVGLSSNTMHNFIGAIHAKLQTGWRPTEGEVVDDLANLPMRFNLMTDDHQANMARRYWNSYAEGDFQVMQVVWTDRNGKFPDEEGFEAEFVGRQSVDGTPLHVG